MHCLTQPPSRLEFLFLNTGLSVTSDAIPQRHLDVFTFQIISGVTEIGIAGPRQVFGIQTDFRDGVGKFTLQLGPDTIAMGHMVWDELFFDEAWTQVKRVYDGVHIAVPSWFAPLEVPSQTPWLAFMVFPGSPTITAETWGELSAVAFGLGFAVMRLGSSDRN